MDYVAYHSAELMGQPLDSGLSYGMLSRKSVSHLVGKRVWGIHSRTPAFTIEEIMAMIEKEQKNAN